MPSKRQPSKQRRAAQNRATRAQLEARRQRAGELKASADHQPDDSAPAATGDSQGVEDATTDTPTGGRPAGLFGGLFGGGMSRSPSGDPVASGLVATRPDGTRLPGARAAFAAVVLAVVAVIALLFLPLIELDDRGEPVPPSGPGQFRGLYLAARAMLANEGQPIETENLSMLQHVGPQAVFLLLVPLAIVAYSYWTHRRSGLSRPLTIGMLALAAIAFLLSMDGSSIVMFFMPPMIALAVASFQARKAELPARMAERAARSRRDDDDDDDDDDDVIDVDSVEEIDDEPDDDEDEFDYEYEDADEELEEDDSTKR